jgi:hypothetical protein
MHDSSLRFVACTLLLSGVLVFAQDTKQPKEYVPPTQAELEAKARKELKDAVAAAGQTEFTPFWAQVLADANATDAVPNLKKMFAREKQPFFKAKLAQTLIKLGDHDQKYWDYLTGLATTVLKSDAPNPVVRTEEERQKFIAWAKANAQNPDEAGTEATYFWPGYISMLAMSGDIRAIPYLRQALLSTNPMIQAAGANGLAELQDTHSIRLILDKCKSAEPDMARMFSQALIYFDDSEAQHTADLYLPPDLAKAMRENKAKGQGALHMPRDK